MSITSRQPQHLYLSDNAHCGVFPFHVEPFSEDYRGRLSWCFLGNHLLRCASLHAGMCGFGYEDMQRIHHAWVLSRLVIDIHLMPITGQPYTIETWVNKTYRQFTDRLFAITGVEGVPYGFATSTWALIDIESRHPMELATLPNGGFADRIIAQDVPVKGFGHIRLKDKAMARQLTAYYSDLDINGHVNSIRYIEMMLDLFPKEIYDKQHVARLEVAYCNEAHSGDTLTLYTAQAPTPDTTLIEICKADNLPVVKAAITFAPDTGQAACPAQT